MSYQGEPPLSGEDKPERKIGDSIRIRLPNRFEVAADFVPTWPDLAYWREVAEQRERDLDAARAMICELTRRPTVEEYNALVTELRRRGWPGPAVLDSRKDIVAPPDSKPPAFPLRALRAKQWGPR